MDTNFIRAIAVFVKEAGELTYGLLSQNKALTVKAEELQKAASQKTPEPVLADATLAKEACDALAAAKLIKPNELQSAQERLQKEPDLGMKFLKAAADEVASMQKLAKPMARVASGVSASVGESKRESDKAYEHRFGQRV